jgi:hypothetical protein
MLGFQDGEPYVDAFVSVTCTSMPTFRRNVSIFSHQDGSKTKNNIKISSVGGFPAIPQPVNE